MLSSICRVRQRVKSLSKINSLQSLLYFSFPQHSGRPYSELDCARQAVLYPFVCETGKFLCTVSLKEAKPEQRAVPGLMCEAGPAPDGAAAAPKAPAERKGGTNSDSSHCKDSSQPRHREIPTRLWFYRLELPCSDPAQEAPAGAHSCLVSGFPGTRKFPCPVKSTSSTKSHEADQCYSRGERNKIWNSAKKRGYFRE